MKSINLLSVAIFFISALLFQSCDKDNIESKGIYDGGIFISNEGNFGDANGSVSFYSLAGDSVVNNIFEKINNRTLGDVVQSMSIFNDKAYICVNASNKIEIANKYSFVELGVIDELPMVRHFMAFNENKGYATVWGDGGQLKVLNLSTNTVSKSIDVGSGPEKMAIVSNKLYVANSGGFGQDNTISVINTETDELLKTITLDADNPIDIVNNGNGTLSVLCTGRAIYDANWTVIDHTPAKLVKINTLTDETENTIVIFDEQHPTNLEISNDGSSLYYGAGFGFNGIYKINISTLAVPVNPIISKYFYGFNVQSNDEIYATEASSFTDNGVLYRYKADGSLINEYTVGIAPNGASSKRGEY